MIPKVARNQTTQTLKSQMSMLNGTNVEKFSIDYFQSSTNKDEIGRNVQPILIGLVFKVFP